LGDVIKLGRLKFLVRKIVDQDEDKLYQQDLVKSTEQNSIKEKMS